MRGIPLHDYHYKWDMEEKTYGIYSFIRKVELEQKYIFNLYKNWYDSKLYLGFNKDNNNGMSHIPFFGNGMKYVCFSDISLQDATKTAIIEKKKIYEYANKLRKEKID